MNAEEIAELVKNGLSHEEISAVLQRRHAGRRGYSARSIRRFCQQHGISRRGQTTDGELDNAVHAEVESFGHSYGRKTMQGLLASHGVFASEGRVGRSLLRVAPEAQQLRARTTNRRMNPVPYFASHFGDKLHFDQNEKLGMFGATHVLAIDGYSRKVVGFITIPMKNAVAIYEHLFRPLVLQVGLFDQLRTDKGTEFCLMLAVQESLGHLRNNIAKPPYRQTKLVHNLRAERFWVEINQRVNYPLKAALVYLEESGTVDMNDQLHRFCVSEVVITVAHAGCMEFINAWNLHRIPGQRGGVPNVLAYRSAATAQIPPHHLPSVEEAVAGYTEQGGTLTLHSPFGEDPLSCDPQLVERREELFWQEHPDLTAVFSEVVHGHWSGPRDAITLMITITVQLAP